MMMDYINTLVLIGALNWGLIGLFDFNLVSWVAGFLPGHFSSIGERIVYVVVGVAAFMLVMQNKMFKTFFKFMPKLK